MPDPRSAFADAMYALGYGEAPERQLTPAEVSARARANAEAQGIKYKSARRRIERRRTTGREARGQPNRRFAAAVERRGLRVTAKLDIDPSPGATPKCRPRTIEANLPGEFVQDIGRLVDALARSQLGEAESAFFGYLMREYENAPDGSSSFLEGAYICSVEVLDIEFQDT